MQSVPISTNVVSLNPSQPRCTRYNIMWYFFCLSVTCGRSVVFPGTLVFSNNKTDRHDISEILLKVASNSITLTSYPNKKNNENELIYGLYRQKNSVQVYYRDGQHFMNNFCLFHVYLHRIYFLITQKGHFIYYLK